MTQQVRREIEELLKDFGKQDGRKLQIPLPPRRDRDDRAASSESRTPGSEARGARIIEVREADPKQLARQRAHRRAQRRGWNTMMREAGLRLPFPEDHEAIHEILAHTLGRMVGHRMMPRDAEAIVRLCRLMLRS